ncbi:COP9 signalosome 5A [Artemisia annua]|uniref:COP9 signalosome complex subunit 5 n=1 Tax=Artemisia annua TaxID=35608 RepID=A0A2U1MN00_ARTAN|nr:COP9 signalosome 5A [Artemisia annua]
MATGRLENVVGWYHSHPGYGCWLSGIDVSTKMLNQQYQEPFLAVVIDPTRTVSAGYKPSDEPVSEYQTIPLNKIEDFGVHCKQSSLDCHLLDLLWNKYWVNTLSSSPLLGNGDYVAGQISDLAEKLEQAEGMDYVDPAKKSGVKRKIVFAACLVTLCITMIKLSPSFGSPSPEKIKIKTVMWLN